MDWFVVDFLPDWASGIPDNTEELDRRTDAIVEKVSKIVERAHKLEAGTNDNGANKKREREA